MCSWVGHRAPPDGFNNPPDTRPARGTFFLSELSTASLRPDRLRRTEVDPSAYVTHSRSPEVGGILECGGKRSATPLSLAQLSRESRVTSRFVRSKITPARKKRRRRFALPAHSKMRKRQWR